MTPELKQAIEILQFNAMELNEFIKEELLENPVLQKGVDDMDNGHVPEQSSLEAHGSQELSGEAHVDVQDPVDSQGPIEAQQSHEAHPIDWREVAASTQYERSSAMEYDRSDEQDELSYDSLIASETTLVDHLLEQLKFSDLSVGSHPLAYYLIHSISSKGYLDIDVQDVLGRFGIDLLELEEVIKVIHTFDPPGVGARNLKECLCIQIDMLHPEESLAKSIVEHYLDDLAANRLQLIAKNTHSTIDCVNKAVQVIKKLEPKPGRMFASLRDVRYIVPDVVVEEMDGEYVILVNETTAPRLHISNYYRTLLERGENDSATEYVNKKLNAAMRLIKNIEQRRNTIYRVVETLLMFQEDFFKRGPSYLKPLNLKDISEQMGVHESTVSRAVNGKYIQCRQGIYEMKYFFPSGLSSSGGDDVSAESIKRRIKALVDGENHKKPISDQDMADILTKEGIGISRRTIAKYREELHIPGSSKRKQY